MPAPTLAVEPLDLDLVDPHPRNPRRDLGDLTELTASIKTDGIRNPIHVGISPDGQRYVVLAGHRRRQAAIAAGLATIPAIIREDVTTDAAALVEMAVENLLRADLTPIEEATLFEQLQIAGLKPVTIAKRTGRKRATVDARLALLALPETARDAIHGAQLSLDDAAALVEFADDEKTVARLTAAAGTSDFRWQLQNARRRREEAAKEAATRSAFEAAGVAVVDQPDMWWTKVLSAVVDLDNDGADLDLDAREEARRAVHETCPHHAAYVDRGGEAVYICLHPSTHRAAAGDSDDDEHPDHDDEAERTGTSPATGRDAAADREAMLAKQAKDREDCETAAGIRKAHVLEHTTGARTIPALAADEIGRLWVAHAVEFYIEVEPILAAGWLGLDLTDEQRDDLDEASKAVQHFLDKRTGTQALLAVLATVNEDNLNREGNWGTWPSASIAPGSSERRWLDFLVDELGYDVTAWERARLEAADQAASARDAAAAAEEAAGDEDDEA